MPLVAIPVVLALILAATLDPLVLRLMRGGRSRTIASAIAVGGGFLAVLVVLAITVLSLVNQAGDLHAAAASGAATASADARRPARSPHPGRVGRWRCRAQA